MNRTIGAAVKLLYETVGHECTVELRNGELYRGLVVDVSDNWNMQMQSCLVTARDGKNSRQEYVYIRGSQIRFVVVPDILQHTPVFQRFTPKDRAAVTGNLAKTAKKKKPVKPKAK